MKDRVKTKGLGLAVFAAAVLIAGLCTAVMAVPQIGDMDYDGVVDWYDLPIFAGNWLAGDGSPAALNGIDGVGGADFAELAKNWLNAGWPASGQMTWANVTSQSWDTGGTKTAALSAYNNIHPRFLLNASKITALKAKIAVPGSVSKYIWETYIKPRADEYKTWTAASFPNSMSTRAAGRPLPWVALAYLLTDDTTYSTWAIAWADKLRSQSSSYWNNSLEGGENLFNLAIAYDWLYTPLTSSQRTSFATQIRTGANKIDDGAADQVESFLANHNSVEYIGVAAAGFVMYDHATYGTEATGWIEEADLIFQTALALAANDGSSTEGHQYWGYSMESILPFIEAARDLMGTDYFQKYKNLQKSIDFIDYMTLPKFGPIAGKLGYANCAMGYGDSYRDYRSHGPVHILCKLAAEYDNSVGQWFAKEFIYRGIGMGYTTATFKDTLDMRAWETMLWYDETLTPVAPAAAGIGTFKYFEDTGYVTSRSDWTDEAVMVAFKCGPFHGHKLQPYYYRQADEGFSHIVNGSHNNPDTNTFQIYAYGKWLATEPGYAFDSYLASNKQYTYDHCAITAGGLGQLGEGGGYFQEGAVISAKASSSIIKAVSNAQYDYLVGDGSDIYRSASLTKFLRHFIYIKPDIIVVVDELAASAASNYYQWRLRTTMPRWHFRDTMDITGSGNSYIIWNNNDSDIVVMDTLFRSSGAFSTSVLSETVASPAAVVPDTFLVADFDSTGADTFVTVMHPRRDEMPAASITSSSVNSGSVSLTIQIGAQTINMSLNLATRQLSIL